MTQVAHPSPWVKGPGPLYHSPIGLYPFQAEHVAYIVVRKNNLAAHDTGLGKSHLCMASVAIMLEDDLIDVVLLVVERSKMSEWVPDFATFTDIPLMVYDGPKAKRERLRSAGFPPVVLTTYETAREDLVVKDKADPRKFTPGPLTEHLAGKRVIVVYDEMTRLGNRGSLLHRANLFSIKFWGENVRLLGLTATPIDRSPESYYNLGRILTPATVGTVKSFHAEHVVDYDMFGNPSKFKNLELLAQKMAPVLLRKRKTDPDVRDQFPTMVEKFTYIELSKSHLDFYNRVKDDVEQRGMEDPLVEKAGFGLLRMIVGHPLTLLDSRSVVALDWATKVSREELMAMGSSKMDHLIDYLRPIIDGQGERAVVFTYYVQILRHLEAALRAVGASKDSRFSVATYHGQMSHQDRDAAREAFRSGSANILLTSTAGERGINLPEAGYLINYDLPSKHSSYIQRINRISRIGSNSGAEVVARSFIASQTVEEGIANMWLGRNQQSDVLIDGDFDEAEDDLFLTSAMRRSILRAAKRSAS